VAIYGLKSLFVDAFQLFQRLISIRKRLKISQILARPTVTLSMKLNTFLNLLLNALFWSTIRRVEGLIAAKSATTCADFAVAIRATEARINADFLHATAELLREVVAVAIETPIVAPRKGHGLE
jgi:hypothetical protein